MHYLNSYQPLAFSKEGREVVSVYGLLPFVDASCRREPDFESPYPSITAICRFRLFAPRLCVGDSVAYITWKGSYPNEGTRHRREIALLKILHTFKSHYEAAEWYRLNRLQTPSNCIVFGNPPMPLEKTNRYLSDLRNWDARYRLRASKCGVFHVCEQEFLDLSSPPTLFEETMVGIFGFIPKTRVPPAITKQQYEELKILAMNHQNLKTITKYFHSTVTLLARFLGLSTSQPRATAM